jgi:AcrR family transcriptional regulator
MHQRRTRDKEKTVQDILSAARRLFSERGLHGTSLRDIETASGVSKGLILHHFGTKEKLYATVQNLLTQEYVAVMAAKRQSSSDFRELVAGAIHSSFEYLKGHPDYRRISLWSYLEGQEMNSSFEQRFILSIAETMCAGQQAGYVRKDIDAFLMPFIIRGTIEYWIRKEKLIQNIATGGEIPELGADEHLINALTALFQG